MSRNRQRNDRPTPAEVQAAQVAAAEPDAAVPNEPAPGPVVPEPVIPSAATGIVVGAVQVGEMLSAPHEAPTGDFGPAVQAAQESDEATERREKAEVFLTAAQGMEMAGELADARDIRTYVRTGVEPVPTEQLRLILRIQETLKRMGRTDLLARMERD